MNDRDTITLHSDFIKITCYGTLNQNIQLVIYDDVYGFCKKLNITEENVNKTKRTKNKKIKFNVLLLGMDSMSFPRVAMTMPRTIKFMKENFWLWYRGYHKVK